MDSPVSETLCSDFTNNSKKLEILCLNPQQIRNRWKSFEEIVAGSLMLRRETLKQNQSINLKSHPILEPDGGM